MSFERAALAVPVHRHRSCRGEGRISSLSALTQERLFFSRENRGLLNFLDGFFVESVVQVSAARSANDSPRPTVACRVCPLSFSCSCAGPRFFCFLCRSRRLPIKATPLHLAHQLHLCLGQITARIPTLTQTHCPVPPPAISQC